ncbi:MAG: MFS transporter [Desulfurispora sp.]|uniref:MFS transporter n=1 Tax=Desulfurispora sp. TaxID=3014275 RepID=UPI00404B58BE
MNIRRIILVLGLAGFTAMADNWVVSPIMPSIAHYFNYDLARAGLLITAYMIPFGLFQLVFGPLSDRYGKRQVINTAMFFFAIATALCALATSFSGLLLFRALTGVFAASVMPISIALIGDLVPMQQRQEAIGSFMGISFLGQGLSMAIGGTVAYLLNWRGVFAIYTVLAVISALLLYTVGRQIPSRKNPQSKFLAPYRQLLSNSVSLRVYLTVLLEGILIIGSFSYLGAYISRVYHYNNLYIGLIMTAFGIMAIAGGRLAGRLAAQKGRRLVLALGLVSATLADALIYLQGSSLPLLVLAVALLGLGFIFAHSTLLTIATEFAQMARGAAMSLVAFCFMGGGGLGTALGSRLIKQFGLTEFYGLYAAGLALLVFLALAIVNTQGVRIEAQGGPQPQNR